MPIEVISEDDWLVLMLTVIIAFRLLNCVTDLSHNPFATSASLNKTASAFYLFCFLPLNLLRDK